MTRGVRVLVGAVVLGGPIAVSAGAIWASESLPITVLIGKDFSALDVQPTFVV